MTVDFSFFFPFGLLSIYLFILKMYYEKTSAFVLFCSCTQVADHWILAACHTEHRRSVFRMWRRNNQIKLIHRGSHHVTNTMRMQHSDAI